MTQKTTTMAPVIALVAMLAFGPPTAMAVNRCGTNYSDAASKCDKCPGGYDGQCPAGETCYAGLSDCTESTTINRCGTSYSDAGTKCDKCPNGIDSECPSGETCYAGLPACSSPPTSGGGGCSGPDNPYGPQSKFSCTGSPYCWTKRARWLHNKIKSCFPNIECTTYNGGSTSDHAGNGLDCWSTRGRPCPATGSYKSDLDELASWLLKLSNARPAEVGYVNWRQRQWSQARASSGWRSYGDRGGCTSNHYDHVHISVCAGSYNPYNYGC